MNKKKKSFLFASFMSGAVALATLAIMSSSSSFLYKANADVKSYGITFNSTRNKLHERVDVIGYDGETTIKTDLGNNIGFSYYHVAGTENTWQILNKGGYFYNTDPIHGIQSITLSFNTDGALYSIYYSNDTSFNQAKGFASKNGVSETFDFFGYQPNYFKILNRDDKKLNITSVRVSLSCLNNHPIVNLINENESMGTIEGGGVKRAGSNVTLTATPIKGYRFLGWYDNGTLISSDSSYTFRIGNDDLSCVAKFTYESYNLVVESESSEKGTVSESSGKYNYLDCVTISATTNNGYLFKGWYSGSTLVSEENPYTFGMPANDCSLTACFFTKAEEETFANKYGTRPIISDDGKTIKYGLYPQTSVDDQILISSLNTLTAIESNGWYLYEGDYYAKMDAKPHEANYKFDNGATIVEGETYWFRCEPIVWKVLSNDNGECLILSSILLDSSCFYKSESIRTINGKKIYPNNYEYSNVRAWLNDNFYNSAFALGTSYIRTTAVDNSASTTDNDSNANVCDNTEDKVFLPSYKDYDNSSYGFYKVDGYNESRYCKTSDWARARGASYNTDPSHLYNGYYWTRSPSHSYSNVSLSIMHGGQFSKYSIVQNNNMCARPALVIKIA